MKLKITTHLILFLLILNGTAAGIYGQNTINMLNEGGANDGKTDNTQVIEKAIQKVTQKGGGTIYFPAGNYLTGPITLESNLVIHIDAGATLLFSDNFDQYLPFVETRWEGTVMKSFHPLFYAYQKHNITITGRGKIDGQGEKWWNEHLKNAAEIQSHGGIRHENKWQQLWDRENPDLKVADYYQPSIKMKFFRPPFIQPYLCSNILIEGITIVNSPFWTINPEFCDNVTVRSVTINNPVSPNTDGINPESCRNVHISDCHISVGDDCITLKSGRDEDGRKYNVPDENITITNCTMLNGHGGVVIGSEMSGGVKKVVISNCVFDGTDRGIRVKSMRGRGGVVEDISVSNIVMNNIRQEAFMFNLFYGATQEEPVGPGTPRFRNIHISNVTGQGIEQVCRMIGIREMPIEGISFSNIQLQANKGFDADRVNDLELNNVKIDTQEGIPFKFSNISRMTLQDIKSKEFGKGLPMIDLTDCSDVFVTDCFPYPGTQIFIRADGKNTGKIVLKNNNLINVNKKIQKGMQLKKDAFIVR